MGHVREMWTLSVTLTIPSLSLFPSAERFAIYPLMSLPGRILPISGQRPAVSCVTDCGRSYS
jgi:hypothetical protein